MVEGREGKKEGQKEEERDTKPYVAHDAQSWN